MSSWSKNIAELLALARRIGVSLRVMALLLILNLVATGFEALGVAMLLPIFELLRSGESAASAKLAGRHWEIMREVSAALDIPITLGLLMGISFGFILVRQGFSFFNTWYERRAVRRLAESIRQRVFSGFLRSRTAIQDQSRVGEIVGDLTVELGRALSAIFSGARAVGTVLQMLLYVGGLFVLSASMTLLSIAVISLAGFLTRGFVAKIKEAGAAITETNAQLSAFIVERLERARLIRLSGTERAEAAAFAKLSRRHTEEHLRQKLITTGLTLLPDPIAIGFGYLMLFIGGQLVGLSLEKLGLFVVVLIRLMPIVRGLITQYDTVAGQWPSVLKLDRRLTTLLEAREPRGGDTIFERLEEGIVYDRVSFSYGGGGVPALTDVAVTIPAHRMTALVGPSGAGKSTFVDLLPRLRDPTAGEIRFDGVPITAFSTASLRAGIAFVPQQPQIFNISAAEHIRYGKEDATIEEVREAARLAGALSFIEALPEGFDTPLGEGGLRLSGGQRQRLDIARALVRRAPVLILDEPTSALDAEAEAEFRDALRRLRAETRLTIIVIAHRLSTIADADRIVVLKRGRVEAAGGHDELMAAGGWYAKAHAQQLGAGGRRAFAQ